MLRQELLLRFSAAPEQVSEHNEEQNGKNHIDERADIPMLNVKECEHNGHRSNHKYKQNPERGSIGFHSRVVVCNHKIIKAGENGRLLKTT
jgi:hypothetical protein